MASISHNRSKNVRRRSCVKIPVRIGWGGGPWSSIDWCITENQQSNTRHADKAPHAKPMVKVLHTEALDWRRALIRCCASVSGTSCIAQISYVRARCCASTTIAETICIWVYCFRCVRLIHSVMRNKAKTKWRRMLNKCRVVRRWAKNFDSHIQMSSCDICSLIAQRQRNNK